jgi:hypothetical protein
MACVVELLLQPAHLASLLGADGGALQRLASASHARAGVLLEDGVARVRLAGVPSACAAAEVALWRAAGDAACDASGWFYLTPRGRVHGAFSSAQLRAWFAAGHFRHDQPVRNAASTAWLRVGALLHANARDDDAVEVDSAAADAVASWRSVGAAREPGSADDLMLEAVPPSADAVRLVVDTCVLLTRMPQLQRASDALRGHAFAVVPWTAVCELDGLKSSADGGVAKQARDAIKALVAAMGDGPDGFFRGETVAEWRAALADANAGAPGGRGSGDDCILATALRLRAAGSRVLLVTNDANLRLKALVNGLPACTDSGLPATPAALAEVAAAPTPPPPPPLLLRAPSAEEAQPMVVLLEAAAPAPEPQQRAPSAEARPFVLMEAAAPAVEPQQQACEPLDLSVLDEVLRDAAREAAAAPVARRAAAPAASRPQPSLPLRSFDASGAVEAALAALARGAGPVLDALLLAGYGADGLALMELPRATGGRDVLRALDKNWRTCCAEHLPGRARGSLTATMDALRALGRREGSEAERCALAHRFCAAVAELLAAMPAGLGDAAALAAARADAAILLRSQTGA